MLPLVVHQNKLNTSVTQVELSFRDRHSWEGGARVLPLVVHQNINGEEELGCSRWSFTRIRRTA